MTDERCQSKMLKFNRQTRLTVSFVKFLFGFEDERKTSRPKCKAKSFLIKLWVCQNSCPRYGANCKLQTFPKESWKWIENLLETSEWLIECLRYRFCFSCLHEKFFASLIKQAAQLYAKAIQTFIQLRQQKLSECGAKAAC